MSHIHALGWLLFSSFLEIAVFGSLNTLTYILILEYVSHFFEIVFEFFRYWILEWSYILLSLMKGVCVAVNALGLSFIWSITLASSSLRLLCILSRISSSISTNSLFSVANLLHLGLAPLVSL